MKLRTLVAVLAALIAPACASAEQARYTQASESSSAWVSRWSTAKETWDNVAKFEINPALRTIASNSYGSNCASIASPYPFQWCMNATTRQMQVYSNNTGSGVFGWHNALTINPDGTVAAPATFIPALTTLGINGTRDFAVCDGVVDDSTAISGLVGTGWTIPAGAVCNAPSVYLPAATFVGPGKIKNSSGYLAPFTTTLSAPPTSYGNSADPFNAFAGDVSHLFMAAQQFIIDGDPSVGTLGRPTTGYVQHPETASIYIQTFNSSGWNAASTSNDGRTGTASIQWSGSQSGQGDLTGYQFGCITTTSNPSSSTPVGQPACNGIAGELDAFHDHNLLALFADGNVRDNGFDIMGIGTNFNLYRDKATTVGNYWWGYRVTSLGAQAVDAAYTATGKFKVIYDCADAAGFGAVVPCVTMGAGQRIYGNATNPTTLTPENLATGTEWLEYTAANGWAFGIADTRILKVKSTGADVTGTLSATTLLVPRGTPASSSAACTQNQMMQDATYIYTCVATNTWHRASNGATW